MVFLLHILFDYYCNYCYCRHHCYFMSYYVCRTAYAAPHKQILATPPISGSSTVVGRRSRSYCSKQVLFWKSSVESQPRPRLHLTCTSSVLTSRNNMWRAPKSRNSHHSNRKTIENLCVPQHFQLCCFHPLVACKCVNKVAAVLH